MIRIPTFLKLLQGPNVGFVREADIWDLVANIQRNPNCVYSMGSNRSQDRMMFIPDIFAEHDEIEIKRIIYDHPLAAITYRSDSSLDAEHAPLIFDGEDRLIGHFAASNPIVDVVGSSDSVLAIFSGQDSYISPNWYPTKAEHHKHVPTWNYQKVHIYGRLKFLTGEKDGRAVVGKMTKYFETLTNGKTAWKMSDAPNDFMSDMLTKIMPFEIVIEKVLAKSKVGQNRAVEDYVSVAEKMYSNGSNELADRMKSLKDKEKNFS